MTTQKKEIRLDDVLTQLGKIKDCSLNIEIGQYKFTCAVVFLRSRRRGELALAALDIASIATWLDEQARKMWRQYGR